MFADSQLFIDAMTRRSQRNQVDNSRSVAEALQFMAMRAGMSPEQSKQLQVILRCYLLQMSQLDLQLLASKSEF